MARGVPGLLGGSEAELLDLARRGNHGAFERVTGPYLRELHLHCYRMLGSLHDADDLLQETLLRAWRAIGRFESRASVRTWLYRIATNACLNALAERPRRALPSGLARPSDPYDPPSEPILEPIWLESYPDQLLDELEDPAVRYARRETVELAFLVAIQLLPPRQRAVLLLRDVMEWSANEVAALLGTSRVSVNSALQRARNRLGQRTFGDTTPSEPTDEERALLERYMRAFARADVKELAQLLADEVEMTMPPDPTWFRGPQDVIRFLEHGVFAVRAQIVLEPTGANRQPAVALYERGAEGDSALSVQVLTVVGGLVDGITGFVGGISSHHSACPQNGRGDGRSSEMAAKREWWGVPVRERVSPRCLSDAPGRSFRRGSAGIDRPAPGPLADHSDLDGPRDRARGSRRRADAGSRPNPQQTPLFGWRYQENGLIPH